MLGSRDPLGISRPRALHYHLATLVLLPIIPTIRCPPTLSVPYTEEKLSAPCVRYVTYY